VQAAAGVCVVGIRCAAYRTIRALRQVTTEAAPRRMIRSSRLPSSLLIS
jgi:hypothetical protein